MDVETLTARVSGIIQDTSFDSDDILGYFNKGLREIAGKVQVPDLIVVDTVETVLAQPWVTLPTEYMWALFHCASVTHDRIITSVYKKDSYRELLRLYPLLDDVGNVEYIGVRGSRLYYQPIPGTVETLSIQFHGKPTELADDDDEPDFLPYHLHEELMVNFAAKEIYGLIEDGIEGKKINYNKHNGAYLKALAEFSMFVGEDGQPYNMPDEDFESWIDV